ncbi:glycerol uptake facilitator protein [Iodidimonas gelatinilytica]|uniref:Glycerol uptake facilitator protein n=1 Tax=Iodidimonas gelatinilytica TaxID=1236966 RepID=A0A5A7MWB8_9PROT|nr:MIP/aquaporin family protein [Iodidimonas gelatinilytica]GEQ99145.1 glycerol uptake facilitator protein [Iodidimonas gelatinilytica]
MTPFLGEVIGTMVLILFGGGVVGGVVLRQSKAEGAGWIVITAGWGMGVAVAVYMVGGISGAHINPAVTLGLAIADAFPWADVPLYIAGQFLGAFIGAVLVWLHYYPHWEKTPDPAVKRAVFATDPAIAHGPANLFSEVLGSFILVLGVLAIGANQFTEGMFPLVVGLLVFAIGLSMGGTTGYAINPARDLGPRIAHALLPIAGKGPSGWRYAGCLWRGRVLAGF